MLIFAVITFILFIFGLYVLLRGEYRLMGKMPIRGEAARNIGLMFLIPFFLSIVNSVFQASQSPLGRWLNPLADVALLGTVGFLIYTAFMMPDQAVEKAPVTLPSTVNTAIAAVYLGISEQAVLDLIRTGALQARKVGMDYRIHKEILIGYRETQRRLRQEHTES